MRDPKITVVQSYLENAFAMAKIEHRHDFDQNVEKFKVSFKGGTRLLRFGGEFLDDTSEAELLRLFDLWSLSDVLAKEEKLGVLVTDAGCQMVRR